MYGINKDSGKFHKIFNNKGKSNRIPVKLYKADRFELTDNSVYFDDDKNEFVKIMQEKTEREGFEFKGEEYKGQYFYYYLSTQLVGDKFVSEYDNDIRNIVYEHFFEGMVIVLSMYTNNNCHIIFKQEIEKSDGFKDLQYKFIKTKEIQFYKLQLYSPHIFILDF